MIKVRQDGRWLFWHSSVGKVDAANLASYFRLDEPFQEIFGSFPEDPYLTRAIQRFWGLRLLRQDPWECLISYILSIASNIPKISRSIEALCRLTGDRLSMDGMVRHAFPPPEAVAALSLRKLESTGMGFRAPYVREAARAASSGEISLKRLLRKPYGEARELLMELPGVGEKVADCVCLFALEKLEAFPVDRWMKRVIEEGYFRGKRISPGGILSWASSYFGPKAGYAQEYLYYDARTGGVPGRGIEVRRGGEGSGVVNDGDQACAD